MPVFPVQPALSSPLTADADQLLAAAARESDPLRSAHLREQVVLQHRGLAVSLARRLDHRGVDRDDLQQVALLGLVLAARRYRPDIGQGFIAFAVPTINGELKRYFRDHTWSVRPPRPLQEARQGLRSAQASLEQQHQRSPSTAELAAAIGCSVEVAEQAQQVDAGYRPISLDQSLAADESTPLRDLLPAEHDAFARVDTLVSLRPVLSQLTARDQLIVRLRFVDNLTQQQIGRRIGVSQMQVSRRLTDILRRLAQDLLPVAEEHDRAG